MTARTSSSNFERLCNSKLIQSWWSCRHRGLRCSADLAAGGAAPFVWWSLINDVSDSISLSQAVHKNMHSCRCAWWSIDHDRGARAGLAQAKNKKLILSQFLFSAPRCCGFVTSRSQLRVVAVVGENDSLSFFFQAVTYRCAPAFGAFFYWFSVWRRRRRSAWSWRSTVASAGRSSFFLLPWNCLQFVLKAFSFSRQALLACCCNTPGIHNKLAGNESDRARTAVHRPRTRWSRFWFWERIFSKTAHLITFVLRQATVGTLLCDRMILLFSKKPSKNEENYLLIETRDRKQKNKRTFLESIWLCHVASHTATQQTILPTWLDNIVSRIDVAAVTAAASISRHAGHTRFSSRHIQSWTWRQNQSARNLNNFCRAPFRISGHIRWPITPLFFGIFLSFFHSMLGFHYFTSMHGKNLKVLCFKTAIWRTLMHCLTEMTCHQCSLQSCRQL